MSTLVVDMLHGHFFLRYWHRHRQRVAIHPDRFVVPLPGACPRQAWTWHPAGTDPGTYDAVDVAGTLSLDGTLDIRLIDAFQPEAGDSFDILDWGTLAGGAAESTVGRHDSRQSPDHQVDRVRG